MTIHPIPVHRIPIHPILHPGLPSVNPLKPFP